MTKLKRILAGLLAGASIVTMSACSDNTATSGASSQGGQVQQTTESTIDDDIENPVSIGDISIDAGDEVEPAELEYLGSYNITTAGDVKPAYKYFQENYDCSIKVTMVGSLQIQERLTALISSDESPDLVDYAQNSFPLLMSKNMYSPLDEYMDLTAPQWEGLEDYINKYRWNGKNYYYPWAYNANPYFLIYNRGIFEQLGLDDPKELYDDGDWTWDTFKDCVKSFIESDPNGGRTGLYGMVGTSFIDSTGTPFISIGDDGKLVSNVVNPDVERAAMFMQDLKKEGLAQFPEGFIDVSEDPIVQGTAAFQSMGEWIITNYSKKMTKDESLDIFFVPYPRDPNADEYYVGMTTFGYLVPAGSEYTEQACVFINCCRLSNTDEDLAATTKESIMKNKKYTEEQYEFIMEFHKVNDFNCVVDEPYGLDENTSEIISKILNNTVFNADEDYGNMTWAQMRDANSEIIQSQIDYYNGLIESGNA